MTSSTAAPPVAEQSAIAAQEAPAVHGLIFTAAGLGALFSGLLLFLGSGNPATISTPVFILAPLIPAICAVLLWLPLSLTHRTVANQSSAIRMEARRQTISAAGVLVILGAIFFFVEWSARFELSLYFSIMLFAWGSRLKHTPLKWAALPYLAVAVALRVLDFPGEALLLLILGALTVAWPFLARGRATVPASASVV